MQPRLRYSTLLHSPYQRRQETFPHALHRHAVSSKWSLKLRQENFSIHVSRFAPQSSGHSTPNKSPSSPRCVKPVSALHHVISWYSIIQILLSLFAYSSDGSRSLWYCSKAWGTNGPYPQCKLKREPAALQPDIYLACLPIFLQVLDIIEKCVGSGGA